jgi:membrane protease YdiL (CAAX protease family)
VTETALAPRAAVLATAAGCILLAARPALVPAGGDPTAAITGLFAVLLAVGLAWPVPRRAPAASAAVVFSALAVGVGAFAAGRLLAGGQALLPLTGGAVALLTLAAVAEEAFFRRLVYGALLAGGAAVAVGGSALLFALVHVTAYGAWVLPLDLAAGLVLGWQRWVTGSWVVPAATHAAANLLMVAG